MVWSRQFSVVVEYESQGDVSASEFRDVFERENDAVMRCLRNGEHQRQQARFYSNGGLLCVVEAT